MEAFLVCASGVFEGGCGEEYIFGSDFSLHVIYSNGINIEIVIIIDDIIMIMMMIVQDIKSFRKIPIFFIFYFILRSFIFIINYIRIIRRIIMRYLLLIV